MYKQHTFQIPLYEGEFHVVFTDSVTQLAEHFPEAEALMEGGELYADTFHAGQELLLCLNYEYGTPITHGVIAHEALHVTHIILAERNFKPDFHNDEAEAYLLKWVVDSIYSVIPIPLTVNCN